MLTDELEQWQAESPVEKPTSGSRSCLQVRQVLKNFLHLYATFVSFLELDCIIKSASILCIHIHPVNVSRRAFIQTVACHVHLEQGQILSYSVCLYLPQQSPVWNSIKGLPEIHVYNILGERIRVKRLLLFLVTNKILTSSTY